MRRHSLSPLFTWRRAVKDSGLPGPAKHAALNLSLYMSEAGDSAFPSLELQAADCSYSKSTVAENLRLLEQEGWLRRRPGGGRGRRTSYETTIPETVRQPDSSSGESGSPGGASQASEGPLRADEKTPPAAPHANPETVREMDCFGGEKLSGSPPETVRLTAGNCPPDGSPLSRKRQEGAIKASGSSNKRSKGTRTAAADRRLADELEKIGIGSPLRLRALADPERAKAWLAVSRREADTNPAGYFRVGFESGDWPSERINAPAVSRHRWIEETSWQLEAEDAHAIVDEWRDLDQVERSRLHELVDEVRENRDCAAEGAKEAAA